MPYTKQTWVDGDTGGTPLSAARLNAIETGIDTAHDTADAAETPAGAQAKVDAHEAEVDPHAQYALADGSRGAFAASSHTHSLSRCRVYPSAAVSIPNGVITALSFDSEDYDTEEMHSTTVNPNRVTLNKTGLWLLIGQVGYASNATGRRMSILSKNGVEIGRGIVFPTVAQFAYASATTVADGVSGDYIELSAYQDSGAALNTAQLYTHLIAVYLGT